MKKPKLPEFIRKDEYYEGLFRRFSSMLNDFPQQRKENKQAIGVAVFWGEHSKEKQKHDPTKLVTNYMYKAYFTGWETDESLTHLTAATLSGLSQKYGFDNSPEKLAAARSICKTAFMQEFGQEL